MTAPSQGTFWADPRAAGAHSATFDLPVPAPRSSVHALPHPVSLTVKTEKRHLKTGSGEASVTAYKSQKMNK
ncbi:Protein of unknown function, partial [Gryllus bimaculatus]